MSIGTIQHPDLYKGRHEILDLSPVAFLLSYQQCTCARKKTYVESGLTWKCDINSILYIVCIARDCKQLFEQGNTCSGVYTIKPDHLPAFKVLHQLLTYCV